MSEVDARAEMLINASPGDVFSAFCDRQAICRFWLSHSTGDLGPGARVEWTFMVPGAKDTVEVIDFQPPGKLKFKWSDDVVVDMSFAARTPQSTRVSVVVTGYKGPDRAGFAINATEGFAIVLCDLKSLLETGASGGMVRDRALLIADANPPGTKG